MMANGHEAVRDEKDETRDMGLRGYAGAIFAKRGLRKVKHGVTVPGS